MEAPIDRIKGSSHWIPSLRPKEARTRRLTLYMTLALAVLSGCQSLAGRAPERLIQVGGSAGRVVAISPDDSLIAVGSLDGSVRIWDVRTGGLRGGWRAHQDTVNGIVFLDASRILTAGYDGRVAAWTRSGALLREWPAGSAVTAVAAALPAGLVLTGHRDGRVRLWRLDGRLAGTWPAHRGAVLAVAMRPDGRELASSGDDGRVMLWAATGSPVPLPSPPTDARTLVFSPGGSLLVGGGWFDLFRWDLTSGTLRVIPTAYHGIVSSVRFLPDGRLASISRQTDSSVLILDAGTGATLERLGRHDLCGSAVAASPDGGYLASVSDDGTARVWRLSNPAPGAPAPPLSHRERLTTIKLSRR